MPSNHILFLEDSIMKRNEQKAKVNKSNAHEVRANDTVELVFIIDKSGSMSGLEADTVGGFNAMIEKQRSEDGQAYVSTVFFNHESMVIHDREPLETVAPLTLNQYYVGGSTALLDAIGDAIHHIGNIHKYARREDVPAKTIFLITTDGMENASRKYDSQRIKEMIKRQEEQFGWEFVFVAANIDAVETAGSIGIRPSRAANYRHDSKGTEEMFCAMSEAIVSYRKGNQVDDNWMDSLD